MFKRLFAFTLIILVIGLPACSAFAPTETPKEPLRVEWTMWDGDYTLVVAKELGLFEKYGVQVEPVYYDVFSQAVPDLISGKIDAGLFAIGDLINASQRIPAQAIAVYDSGGSSTVVAAPQIQSIADLRGQRVAVNIGTSGELFVREMLETAGLSLQDVNLINMSPELVPQKLAGEIQAGYIWEPYTSQAVQAGNKILFDSASSEVGSLFPDVIVFRQSVIDERQEDVRAFMNAWFEAVEYRKTLPEESRKLVEKALGQDPGEPDPKIIIYGRAENLALFEQGESQVIKRSIINIFETYVGFLISTGSVTRAPEFNDLFNSRLIQ